MIVLLSVLACLIAELYLKRRDKRIRASAPDLDIWAIAFRNRERQIEECVQAFHFRA